MSVSLSLFVASIVSLVTRVSICGAVENGFDTSFENDNYEACWEVEEGRLRELRMGQNPGPLLSTL